MVDTNVLLDVWLAREPFWKASALLMARAERGEIEAWICPTTITTLHYLGKKVLGERTTRGLVKRLLKVFHVGELTSEVFSSALTSKVSDFEDAIIESVAFQFDMDLIATRNTKDFRRSRVPARDPSVFIR